MAGLGVDRKIEQGAKGFLNEDEEWCGLASDIEDSIQASSASAWMHKLSLGADTVVLLPLLGPVCMNGISLGRWQGRSGGLAVMSWDSFSPKRWRGDPLWHGCEQERVYHGMKFQRTRGERLWREGSRRRRWSRTRKLRALWRLECV